MGGVYSSKPRAKERKKNEILSLRNFYLLSELLSNCVLDMKVN